MQRFSDNGRSPDHVDHKRWYADLIINLSLYRDKVYVYDSAIDLVKRVCQAGLSSKATISSLYPFPMRFLIVFTLAAAVVSTSAFHVIRQSIPPGEY